MVNDNIISQDSQFGLFSSSVDEVSQVAVLLNKASNEQDPLSAYIIANQAGELAQKHELKKSYAESLLIQVTLLLGNGAYNEAMAKNMEALAFFKDSEFRQEEANCWRNLGMIYNLLYEHDKQLEYYLNCYEITKELNDKDAELEILNNIGDNYLSLKNYAKALEIFRKNLDCANSNKKLRCVSLKNIGAALFYLQQYDEAMQVFKETIELANEIDATPLLAAAHFYQGKVCAAREDYVASLSHLEISFATAKELKELKKERLIILDALVTTCLKLNHSTKALNYLQTLKELETKLKNQISNRTIKKIQFKYEILEIEKEKEILRRQNTLLQEANDQIEQQRKELELKSIQLENANKELKNFAHVVSHDIKEPIRTIKTYTAFLEKELKDNLSPKAEEFLGYVCNAASHISTFVSDVLEYTTTGQAEIKKSRETVDCNDVIFLIKENLKAHLTETQATINYSDLPVISAHQTLIVQVFQNLISNAIKFRKPDVKPVVTITADQNVDHFVFRLQDNGIGIKEENIGKVFNLFTRLNDKSTYEGSGIGLSTVQKILAQYGGEIKVESVFGQGTAFIFTIPK